MFIFSGFVQIFVYVICFLDNIVSTESSADEIISTQGLSATDWMQTESSSFSDLMRERREEKTKRIHEEVYSGVDFSEIERSCDEGRAYSSIKSCLHDCQRRNEGSMESIYNMSYPFNYKVLLLLPTQFNVTNNADLNVFSLKLNVSRGSYVLQSDGSARVCLPLIEDLETCNGWNVNPNELQFYEDGHRMWHKVLRRYYEWNEFFFLKGHVIICESTELQPLVHIHKYHLVGNVFSTVCLCITIIFAKYIDDLHKNILLLCHIVMLTFGFIVSTFRRFHPSTPPTICIVTSAMYQFFNLSAFFWMTMQAFDIYAALKGMKTNEKINIRRFLSYSTFCWGFPLFLTSFAVITEVFEIPSLRPEFKIFCFFSYSTATSFGYYFGWMGLSIFVNFIIFLLIVCKVRELKKQYSQKKLVVLSITLAIIMGFFWIFNVLAWTHVDEGIVIWCFSVISSFQGVFIFLIYVCRKKYIKNIALRLQKVCSRKNRQETEIEMSGNSKYSNTKASVLENVN